MFLVFLAAENLKNAIPALLGRGTGERESCFWCSWLPKT